MQSLLQQAEQLRQENQEFQAQMVKGHHLQNHHTFTQQINLKRSHNQVTCSSWRHTKSSCHVHEEDFSSSRSPTWLEPTYPSTDQSYPNETTSSIRGKKKMGQQWGSRLSDTMRAHLGP